MKKQKTSIKTIALLAVAALLFAGGGYTATRAALNIYSPQHFLQFETDTQKAAIQENEKDRSVLLSDIGEKVSPGKEYKEELRAVNKTDDADQFVRIVVRKYWMKDGEKQNTEPEDPEEFFPDLSVINLTFINQDLWQINAAETTTERTVYYYKNVVGPGEATKPLTGTLTLNSSVAATPHVSGPDQNGIVTYKYDYDGYTLCIEAEAQSIQTHNPNDAVKSIWGVTNVTASGTTLTVN